MVPRPIVLSWLCCMPRRCRLGFGHAGNVVAIVLCPFANCVGLLPVGHRACSRLALARGARTLRAGFGHCAKVPGAVAAFLFDKLNWSSTPSIPNDTVSLVLDLLYKSYLELRSVHRWTASGDAARRISHAKGRWFETGWDHVVYVDHRGLPSAPSVFAR